MNSLSFEIARFLDGDRPDAPAHIRLLAGASLGGVFASFALLLGVLWWVQGSEVVTRQGVIIRLDWLTFLYPIGAISAGALLFLLAPLSRNRVGKAILGAFAFVPWLAAIAWCIDRGYSDWRPVHTILSGAGATALGFPIGWFASFLTQQDRREASPTAI